jgi:hypothetical protein
MYKYYIDGHIVRTSDRIVRVTKETNEYYYWGWDKEMWLFYFDNINMTRDYIKSVIDGLPQMTEVTEDEVNTFLMLLELEK